jgi:N-acetylglutamate synthase-like GNAT family acetyltransferase
MPEQLTTRQARLSDAAELTTLVNSAYRGESSRQGWTTEADILGGQRTDVVSLREIIARPRSVVLVHEAAGRIAACVHLEFAESGCYIGMVTVAPDMQARGLGLGLLTAAERYAQREWRCVSAFMTVIVQRLSLIAWYERCGYQRTGVRKPFPYGDERFGVPLRPDLEFEVLRKTLPQLP